MTPLVCLKRAPCMGLGGHRLVDVGHHRVRCSLVRSIHRLIPTESTILATHGLRSVRGRFLRGRHGLGVAQSIVVLLALLQGFIVVFVVGLGRRTSYIIDSIHLFWILIGGMELFFRLMLRSARRSHSIR